MYKAGYDIGFDSSKEQVNNNTESTSDYNSSFNFELRLLWVPALLFFAV